MLSNYFFVAINVIILISSAFLYRDDGFSIYISVLLAYLGILLTTYWLFEQRETHVIHEVRFRTMMKLEAQIFEHGILEEEWERLGDYPFRRSPVMFIKLARALPLVFAMAHCAMIVLFIFVS